MVLEMGLVLFGSASRVKSYIFVRYLVYFPLLALCYKLKDLKMTGTEALKNSETIKMLYTINDGRVRIAE